MLNTLIRSIPTDLGSSIGAFAVGKGIVQFEGGFEYRKNKHQAYNNSTVDGSIGFLAARWGFLSERLELTYQGSFMFDKLTNKTSSQDLVYKRKGLLQNFLGIKFLIYDPFKKEEKTNVYSWKANNGFKIKHLIPAVSLTAGGNFKFGKNHPYPYGDVFDVLYRPIFYQNLGVSAEKEPFFFASCGFGHTIAFFENLGICDQLYTRSIPDRTNRQKLYPYPYPHFSSTVVGLSWKMKGCSACVTMIRYSELGLPTFFRTTYKLKAPLALIPIPVPALIFLILVYLID